MTRKALSDPYMDAKLLGILLSGVFGHTRAECAPEARARWEQSGTYRISLPEPTDEPKA